MGVLSYKHALLNGLNDKSVVNNTQIKKQRSYDYLATPARILLPRGLVNFGNTCFLNATLQALLACSPFVQLLRDLATRHIRSADDPTLYAFSQFISDFGASDFEASAFCPIAFAPVLEMFIPDLSSAFYGLPRQEDAQEFLGFVLERLRDELEGQSLLLGSHAQDDGWETLRTRDEHFDSSRLSAIFGGELMSVVEAKGCRPSATAHPFVLLHLDILPEFVRTINDALCLFTAPETLEGYRPSDGEAEVVDARKSVKLQRLPKILMLHLMRFSYGSRGSTKLCKHVHFPLELTIDRSLLANPSAEERRYELVASITHHGQGSSTGHYTADAKYCDGQWFRYNDASVTAVGTNQVLHGRAYILFYRQV